MSIERKEMSALSRSEYVIQQEKRAEAEKLTNIYDGRGKYKAKILAPHLQQTPQSNLNDPASGTSVALVRTEICESFLPDPDDPTSPQRQRDFARGCHPILNQETQLTLPIGSDCYITPQGEAGSPETTGEVRHCRISGIGRMTLASLRAGGGDTNPAFAGLGGLFNNNGGNPLPPANPPPEEIAKKAQSYDESTDLPNKDNHTDRFATEMHPEFVAYAKAVIFDMWDQKQATVVLNSTFRTVGVQREMKAKWEAWIGTGTKTNPNGTGPNPNYAAAPATPGYSKHNLGTAIDFNASIGGKEYGSVSGTGTTKEEWVASGLADIITSNGLVWGGTFTNNYDPIHMHLEVSEAKRKEIVDASGDITDKRAAVAAISAVTLKA